MKYLDDQADKIDYRFSLDRIRRNNIRKQAYNDIIWDSRTTNNQKETK
jgi:hypothetical protein